MVNYRRVLILQPFIPERQNPFLSRNSITKNKDKEREQLGTIIYKLRKDSFNISLLHLLHLPSLYPFPLDPPFHHPVHFLFPRLSPRYFHDPEGPEFLGMAGSRVQARCGFSSGLSRWQGAASDQASLAWNLECTRF